MSMKDCIFCKIANGLVPSDTVYEDENFRAILDLNPAEKGHTLVLTKKHFDDIFEADDETLGNLFRVTHHVGKAVKEALFADGINIVQNNGKEAGQTVSHLHVHIIPRFKGHTKIVSWIQHDIEKEEQKEIAGRIKDKLSIFLK